jgi:hypothetical protein
LEFFWWEWWEELQALGRSCVLGHFYGSLTLRTLEGAALIKW